MHQMSQISKESAEQVSKKLETETDASPVFRSILLGGGTFEMNHEEQTFPCNKLSGVNTPRDTITSRGVSQTDGVMSGVGELTSDNMFSGTGCSPAVYTVRERTAAPLSNGRRKLKKRGELHDDIFLENYKLKKSQKEDQRAKQMLKDAIAAAQDRSYKYRQFFSKIGFSSDE